MKIITNDMVKTYEQYLINDEKAKATIEKYVRDVLCFYSSNKNCQITKSMVLEYKNKLLEHYAPSSVNSVLSSLNSFFDFLGWTELKVKTVKIQKQLFANDDKSLTKAEYERLLGAAKNKNNWRLNLIMQSICSTGIRISELKYITVEALSDGKAQLSNKGKTRVIFLPSKLCKVLKQYVKEQKIKSGAVFVTKNGKPLDRSNIWSDMKKLCESAKVLPSKVFPHNLRHLFARTYYSIQKDIVRLADILGHSSVNTTRIYTQENGEIHRQQIQKLGLLRC
ncbi:MAG: integrase [Ruminococcaceae bacterium]|nr:integrase [Oscillospiraceae bacterium]